ncbi:MAG TPA: XRE family transcriptional regulator [Kofleriaceae bacterium]|nr:XRE family transcriptional regulator [Kofleriaceae bacterium]
MGGEHDHLADNIKALRETRGLSQQQMAKAAGIPRATWTHLESGAANPTLAVLIKVAAALQVRLDELLASPRQPARFLKAAELPTRDRGQVLIRKLLPEPLPGLDMERMTLPPGARMAGVPHTPGTREYLTCERGSVELAVAGQRYTLDEGDVVSFRGDQRHAYFNPGKSTAIAYSAIAFAPTTA